MSHSQFVIHSLMNRIPYEGLDWDFTTKGTSMSTLPGPLVSRISTGACIPVQSETPVNSMIFAMVCLFLEHSKLGEPITVTSTTKKVSNI